MSVLLRQSHGFEACGTARIEPDAQNLPVAEHGHVAAEKVDLAFDAPLRRARSRTIPTTASPASISSSISV